MSAYEVLQRHLEREIQARKQAEELSEKKIYELYEANCRLEEILTKQKKIDKELQERTHAVEIEKAKVEKERYAKTALQRILESPIEYSIVACNLQGMILSWNKGAEYNYGYKADELVHKKNMRLLHVPEDVNSGRVDEFFNMAYHAGTAEGIFERVRKNNTRFTATVNLSLISNEVGVITGFVMISKDITKDKLLEEKLIRSNQELEQFAYIASHDLKAPLRAIDKLSSWIAEDSADKLDLKSKENLMLLRKRVARMANLIDGILQYSRAGRVDLDIDEVNTQELLKEVIDSLNPSKRFTIKLSDELPCLKTARIPLSQVFANLISNSIKHHQRTAGKIDIGVRDLGTYYEFYVADDGPGIEPEYFHKIFEVFQTLQSKDELESTGIGLSIVKKIIESQGGAITVESKKGKGATFRFTWPKQPHQTDSH